MKILALGGAVAFMVGLVLLVLPHGRQLCVGCRLERRVVVIADLDLPYAYASGACSRWVTDHVPDHRHAWRRAGCWMADGWIACHMQPPGAMIPDARWLAALQAAPDEVRGGLLAEAASITLGEEGFAPVERLRARVEQLIGPTGGG